MKILEHPNVVQLVEVIDDPTSDHFYMGTVKNTSLLLSDIFTLSQIQFLSLFVGSVLEYVDGKWSCEGCGPQGGLGEETSKKYLQDIVAGLIYLHSNVSQRLQTHFFFLCFKYSRG